MLNKISDLQCSILRAAALREDRLLPLPANLKGRSAKRIEAKLIDAGRAKEVKAPKGAPKIARVELLGLAERVGRFGRQPYSEAGRPICATRDQAAMS